MSADKTSAVSADKTSVVSADKTSVVSADISQDIPPTFSTQGRPRSGRPCLETAWGMSWEMSADTTDVLSADTTDVLSADTTDVLSADTTDVLSADTFPSENPTSRICKIWHLKNGIWSPFGHIGRSPSSFCRSRTNSVRRRQLWGSQDVGTTLFLWNQESDGVLCSQQILALDFGMGWGGGLGLAEDTVSLGFPERFPTFMGLRKPKEERMGPPDVAKVGL